MCVFVLSHLYSIFFIHPTKLFPVSCEWWTAPGWQYSCQIDETRVEDPWKTSRGNSKSGRKQQLEIKNKIMDLSHLNVIPYAEEIQIKTNERRWPFIFILQKSSRLKFIVDFPEVEIKLIQLHLFSWWMNFTRLSALSI